MATIGPLHDEDKTQGMLDRLQQRQRQHGCSFWAMERKADGRVLGFCGVSRGTVPHLVDELEIGWRMAFDCWGQGYAREAALATLGWIAENHPGEEVWAITARTNERSQGLMKRLGMRYREGMDFEHPLVADDSELKPHVTYWLQHA
jgi:RimJ/RimL family protein N-acetyltransferase